MSVTTAAVEAAIATWIEPGLGKDLVSADCIDTIDIDGDHVTVAVRLGFPTRSTHRMLIDAISAAVRAVPGVTTAQVTIETRIVSHLASRGGNEVRGVKNIIAVASGKGGVGKSTTAANLALALSAEGARVGVLDADIYGPSQPRMLGISGKPDTRDGKRLEPLVNYGIQTMSAGFLVDEETPMIWRGPMVTQALEQLLRDTNWNDVDYLVVDMPPGTGDIQLTLAQKVPVSGAVIVTTPQDIALLDARKGFKMFEKVKIPVLGVIENMGMHICSQCGHQEAIFGEGGGVRMAEQYALPFLGSLPLDIHIREHADGGKPSVIADPDGAIAQAYRDVARTVAASLSQLRGGPVSAFPTITVTDS